MTQLRTYKFLARGAVGPISGFAWPTPAAHAPGAWLETEGDLEPCVRGTHVCRTEDLAYWIHDELWETEADGESVAGFDCLVTRRARLVRRFDGWQNGGATRFVLACADHAAEIIAGVSPDLAAALGCYVEDARVCADLGLAACGAFSTALAVSKAAGTHAPEASKAAYRGERIWQASWIVRHVIGN
jgi:hypothetical protein